MLKKYPRTRLVCAPLNWNHGMGLLQLSNQVVQNRHTGKQMTHWDMLKNRTKFEFSLFNMSQCVICSPVCLFFYHVIAQLQMAHWRFTVVSSSSHHKRKRGNFTLLFRRGRHGVVPPHVQHAYFVSFYQWNSSFVAFSLPFQLSILKLLIMFARISTRKVIFN